MKKIKKYKTTIVEILFILLMLVAFARYGLEMNIPEYILLIIAILIATIGDEKETIAMCICCIPLYTMFNYIYAVLYGCILILLKNCTKVKINFLYIIFILMVIWELLHGFMSSYSIKQTIGIFVPYILLILLQFIKITPADYNYISIKFAKFVITLGIISFSRIVIICGGNISYAISQIERLGTIIGESDIVGGQINPNSLGIICVFAIIVMIQNYLFIYKKNEYVLYILVLMSLGVLTLSRTYIVLLAITFVLFYIGYRTNIKAKIKLMIIIIGSLCSAYIIVAFTLPDVLRSFVQRWLEEDLSNGRLIIMSEAFDCIWNNSLIALFGTGVQNYYEEVTKYVAIPPHDALSELLMIWGLPGLLLFVIFIFMTIFSAKKKNENMNLINYIPMIILIIKSCAGHLVTSGYAMLSLSLVYLSLVCELNVRKTDINRENDLI